MRRFSLITGGRGSGKSSYIFTHYRGHFGYVTLKADRFGHVLHLVDLESGDRSVLMKRKADGSYAVNQEAFDEANRHIASLSHGLVVLDECGWMEAEGEGFYPSLLYMRENKDISAILSVRGDRLDWYIDFFGLENVSVKEL